MAEWFRSWHGAPTDPKWLLLANKAGVEPGKVAAVAWALYDHASQQSPRGSVGGFDPETVAAFYGWPQGDVEKVLDAMEEKRVIEDGHLSAWSRRQPKREDQSTERVRAFRAKRNATKRNETQRNADETREEESREEEIETDGAAAPVVDNPVGRILGRARELGFPVDDKMAGMVGRWLKGGKREVDIMAGIEGLSLLYVDGKFNPPKDLRPLYAKESDRTWAWCEQRWNDQQKRMPRIGGATPASVIFGRSA